MNILKKYKTLLITLICGAAVLYAAFLFALPSLINLNNYKKDIQKIVSDSVKLNFDAKDMRIITTPSLKAGVAVSGLELSYPDGRNIAKIENAQVKIALVPLLWKTLRVSDASADSVSLNLNLLKNGQIDVVEYVINNTEQNPQSPENTAAELPVKISSNLPDVVVNGYNFTLKDEKSANVFSVKGDSFVFDKAVLNKHFRVSSKGKVLVNDNTNANYDVKVASFWPVLAASAGEKQPQELPPIDFIKELVKYDPHADIVADMTVKEHQGHVDLDGYLKADNLNIKLNGKKLPDSYFHLTSKGHKTLVDSAVYVSENEKATLNADVTGGHKTKIDLNVKTDKISFSSLQNFAIAVLNSLNLQNDLAAVKAQGYIKADFNVKTDLKKFESDGRLEVLEGAVSHRLVPVSVNGIAADVDFSDNSVNIKTAQALVNGTKISANGTVDSSSNADIALTSGDINIAPLFNAFAPADLKKTYLLKSGVLNIDVALKGKLAEIQPDIDVALSKFLLKTKSPMPVVSVSIPSLKIDVSPQDAILNPFDVMFNSSKISVSGSVKDYIKAMKIDITANGSVKASDIMTLLPKEARVFVGAKGAIPVKAKVTGDAKKIDIKAQAYPDSNNHFSPVTIKKMLGTKGLVNVEMTYSNDSLNIGDASLYMTSKTLYTDDFTANKKGAAKMAGVTGNVANASSSRPDMKINFSVPELLVLSNTVLPDASLKVRGDINVYGAMASPSLKGFFSIKEVNVPSMLTKVQDVDLEFNDSTLSAKVQNLALNGTAMNIDADASTKFGNIFLIKSMKLTSSDLNADNLFKAMDKINAQMSATGASSGTAASTKGPVLPVKISNGSFDIQKFSMKQVGGTLAASNITGDFTLVNDLVKIPNLKVAVYDGTLNGNVTYNVKTTAVTANVKGSKINANPAVTVFAGLKDQITGNVDFNADVKLKGSTYTQQMNSLNGNVHFELKDGQMGSLGRFETFLKADNLLSQSFIATKAGSLISSVSPYNTGKFSYLKGDIKLVNGTAVLDSVKMSGPHMSLLLTGNVNILSMNSTLQILGALSSEVVSALGPVADLSVEKFASYIPKFGAKIASALNTYNEAANKNTLASIPALSPEKTGTKSFKVVLNGNLNNPPSAIKKFQWLNTPEKIKEEQESLNEAVSPKLPTTKEEIKEQVKQDITNALQNNEKVQEIQQNKAVKTFTDIYKFYKSGSQSTETTPATEQ